MSERISGNSAPLSIKLSDAHGLPLPGQVSIGSILKGGSLKRVAYVASISNKLVAVVDEKEEKQFDGIVKGSLTFSPDSRRVAYVAVAGNKQLAVVDGKEEKQCDGIDNLTFSPDSTRLAYAAGSGHKQFVIVDGKEEKQYDNLFNIGGGKIIFDSPDDLHYLAFHEGCIYLVAERIDSSL